MSEELNTGQIKVQVSERKTMFILLKRLIKLLAWSLILIVFLIFIATGLIYLYQDEIKQAAIDEVNKNLRTEVVIRPENIDVTFFKTFPDACVQFTNASVLETLKRDKRDTIIKIGELLLHFNLTDIFKKKYIIREISLTKSDINLLKDANGLMNFIFWKTDTTSVKNNDAKLEFQIQRFFLRDVAFRYSDLSKKFSFGVTINQMRIDGNFNSNIKKIESEGNFKIKHFVITSKNNLISQEIDFKTELKIQGDDWELRNSRIAIEKMNFNLTGGLSNKSGELYSDIYFRAENFSFKTLASLLDENTKKRLDEYEVDGSIYLNGRLKGKTLDYQSYIISAAFSTEKMKINYLPNNMELNDVSFKGIFEKYPGKAEVISMKKITARLNESTLNGQFTLMDLNMPHISFKGDINANIEDITRFYPVDTLESASGKITLHTEISGKAETLKQNLLDPTVQLSIHTELVSVQLQFKNTPSPIQIHSGKLNLDENTVSCYGLELASEESKLKLTGKWFNFSEWIKDHGSEIILEGSVDAETLNWEKIIYLLSGEKKVNIAQQKQKDGILDNQLSVKMNLKIEKGLLKKFVAEQVIGTLDIHKGKILFDHFSFKNSGGEIKLNCLVEEVEKKIEIKGSSELNHLNIHEVFKEFDNFGQSTIIDKNIKGWASAKIDFITDFDANFDLIKKNLRTSCDLTIEDGSLLNYAPLEGLAKYIEIKELRDVRFSTLQTHFDIKEEKISIAKTFIDNSAMDITLSGTHQFNQDIDYRVSLRMSEFLARRPGKKKELDEELKYVENDPENNRKVFLRIYGNMDNIKYKFDRVSAREKIKQDLKNEKQNLKSILREEFGWFRKDTSLNKKTKRIQKKDPETFQIKFGEKNTSKEEDDDDF